MSEPIDGFIAVQCCGQIVGHVNARPFTREATERFCEIQQALGAAWPDDPEANALIADPASYETPADGTPISFGCDRCGAKFAWAGGIPARISSS